MEPKLHHRDTEDTENRHFYQEEAEQEGNGGNDLALGTRYFANLYFLCYLLFNASVLRVLCVSVVKSS
jgi:hypothetical protein